MRRIHAQALAATAQRQTTATTAYTPLIPAATNAKANRPEANVKIQKTSRRSGSNVQRFIRPDVGNFGGASADIGAEMLGCLEESFRTDPRKFHC